MAIIARKNCDEFVMSLEDILQNIVTNVWDGRQYSEYTPLGASRLWIDGKTLTFEVENLRDLIDNLRNGGVNIYKINLIPCKYLNDLQGYNSIVLYRGWFCRVDSCGGVILCKEQEAYDRGLLVR